MAGIGGIGTARSRRGGNHHEELVLPGAEVLEEVCVDTLGICHRVMGGGAILPPQGIAANGGHRISRITLQVRVGVAGLEHDYFVLSPGIGGQPGVGAVLAALGVQGREVCRVAWSPEPRVPVSDVGGVTYAPRAPAIVGVAHEVVVIPKCYSKSAVCVIQPVFTAGMMDEYQLHRVCGRGVVSRFVGPHVVPIAGRPGAAFQVGSRGAFPGPGVDCRAALTEMVVAF